MRWGLATANDEMYSLCISICIGICCIDVHMHVRMWYGTMPMPMTYRYRNIHYRKNIYSHGGGAAASKLMHVSVIHSFNTPNLIYNNNTVTHHPHSQHTHHPASSLHLCYPSLVSFMSHLAAPIMVRHMHTCTQHTHDASAHMHVHHHLVEFSCTSVVALSLSLCPCLHSPPPP